MEKAIPYLAEYKNSWWQEHKEEINKKRKIHYKEHRKEALAKMKIYRENNKEKVAKSRAKYYQESKEEYTEKRKEYYQKNKEAIIAGVKKYRENNLEQIKERKRKKNYGIEPGTYDKMLLEQDNKCCVCYIELDQCKQISIDHCHKSGDVRGLLCSRCNLMLGMVEDNIDILQSAINYLAKEEQ